MISFSLHSGGTQTVETAQTGTVLLHEDPFQVVLFNDDVNTMEHVVMSLMKVFGHPFELAMKITLEAHAQQKAIAEVEGKDEAQLHKDQLQSLGLTAAIEVLG